MLVGEETSTKQTVLQTLATSRGGRMMALDPKTHTSYPATAGDVAPAAQVPGAPRIAHQNKPQAAACPADPKRIGCGGVGIGRGGDQP